MFVREVARPCLSGKRADTRCWRISLSSDPPRCGSPVRRSSRCRRLLWRPLEPRLLECLFVSIRVDRRRASLQRSALPWRRPSPFPRRSPPASERHGTVDRDDLHVLRLDRQLVVADDRLTDLGRELTIRCAATLVRRRQRVIAAIANVLPCCRSASGSSLRRRAAPRNAGQKHARSIAFMDSLSRVVRSLSSPLGFSLVQELRTGHPRAASHDGWLLASRRRCRVLVRCMVPAPPAPRLREQGRTTAAREIRSTTAERRGESAGGTSVTWSAPTPTGSAPTAPFEPRRLFSLDLACPASARPEAECRVLARATAAGRDEPDDATAKARNARPLRRAVSARVSVSSAPGLELLSLPDRVQAMKHCVAPRASAARARRAAAGRRPR